MFLSVRHRILFVHIAKTGGTSIRRALGRLRWTDPYSIPIYIGNHLARATKYRTGCKLHRHSRAMTAEEMLGRSFYQELFKFAFVRNPWDLHVSSWLHIGRMGYPEGQLEFGDFLRTRFDRDRAPVYSLDTLRYSQVRMLSDLDDKLLVDGESQAREPRFAQKIGHRLTQLDACERELDHPRNLARIRRAVPTFIVPTLHGSHQPIGFVGRVVGPVAVVELMGLEVCGDLLDPGFAVRAITQCLFEFDEMHRPRMIPLMR